MRIAVHAEQIVFQELCQFARTDALACVRGFPSVDQPLKRLHQENAGSACRVQYPQVPCFAVPGKHTIQNKVHQMRAGVMSALLFSLSLGYEFLVDATDERGGTTSNEYCRQRQNWPLSIFSLPSTRSANNPKWVSLT